MKKILSAVMMFVFSVAMYAQKDVTKFLGIPVDGSKVEMIRKLKEKGFTVDLYDKDVLKGEFNGTDVNIRIVTNNNKVYRIFISDVYTYNESDIKIRFNNLCNQFGKNKNYIPLDDYTLSADDEISYEMSVHNKRYEAYYFQKPLEDTKMQFYENACSVLLEKYSEEQLMKPTPAIEEEIGMLMLEGFLKKSVWFMIDRDVNQYRILMYYDNEYNKANGEDL